MFDGFPGKKVVLRTLDPGADKPLPLLTDATEPNPALGVRGYRTDFANPGVLEHQLEAITLAAFASVADAWVMAPMISTANEAAQFALLCAAAGLKSLGATVEVQPAALTAASVLGQVGFASIGTNNLTQYAMAVDRQLGPLAQLNSPWQPAVLHLIQLTAVRTALKSVTLEQAQELARPALTPPDALDAKSWVRAKLPILEELAPPSERTATIAYRPDLHAGPVTLCAEAAGESPVEVNLVRAGMPADETLATGSILSLMTRRHARGNCGFEGRGRRRQEPKHATR